MNPAGIQIADREVELAVDLTDLTGETPIMPPLHPPQHAMGFASTGCSHGLIKGATDMPGLFSPEKRRAAPDAGRRRVKEMSG